MYRADIFLFKLTYKLSFVLNWITGRAPRDFFPVIWFAPISFTAASVVGGDPVWLTSLWSVLFVGCVCINYFEKSQIEQGMVHPATYAFSRVIWGFVSVIAIIGLPAGPFLEGLLILICDLSFLYSKYCYLHDIPPRDSVFARAKNKIKEKLGSFSLAPSPA